MSIVAFIAAAIIQIAVFNQSATVTDIEVQEAIDAVQIQMDRDFTPAWDITVRLIFVAPGEVPPKGSYPLTIQNTSKFDPGSCGWHGLQKKRPFAKVIAPWCMDRYGVPWSLLFSHEVLEISVDPFVRKTFKIGKRRYFFEIVDPVADLQWAYEINGVIVSDFVFRNWFKPLSLGPFDAGDFVTHPFEILPGGYLSPY